MIDDWCYVGLLVFGGVYTIKPTLICRYLTALQLKPLYTIPWLPFFKGMRWKNALHMRNMFEKLFYSPFFHIRWYGKGSYHHFKHLVQLHCSVRSGVPHILWLWVSSVVVWLLRFSRMCIGNSSSRLRHPCAPPCWPCSCWGALVCTLEV